MGKKGEAMRRSRAKKAAAGIITARQARNLQSDRGKLLPTVPTVDGVGGTFCGVILLPGGLDGVNAVRCCTLLAA